jgi:GNAT superfamily N-acetyltransferase
MDAERIDGLDEEHLDDLLRLYREEWWTEGRERDDVVRMLEGSDEVLGFAEPGSNELVAFARVLTDGVYKALVFDVVVAESHRGEGVGDRLMEAILDHPRLAGVEHVELYCLGELSGFYERWGFTDDLGDLRLMRRG